MDLKNTMPVPRLLERARELGLFAAGPVVIARAPGRLDVMGGIADYSGSLVCEMPLAAAAAVAVQHRHDGKVICRSAQVNRTVTLDLSQITANDPLLVRRAVSDENTWARYVIGCIWWLAQHGTTFTGVTILVDSDVPLGGGVSSSAAIEVATMSALVSLTGTILSPLRLAAACQSVENQIVGAPCGVMDQVTSSMGEERCMLRILCQAGDDGLPAQVLEPVHVPQSYAFVGIHSGVSHDVAGDPYTDTRVAAFMGQKILSSLDPVIDSHLANIDARHYIHTLQPRLPEQILGSDFLGKYGPTNDAVTRVVSDRSYAVRAAATHHVLEMARVTEFVGLLTGTIAGDQSLDTRMRRAGALMYESHRSYSECANLGHPMTDRLVEMVRQRGPHKGFFGAKITGGGSGGTVAILIRDDDVTRNEVQNLRNQYEKQTGKTTMYFEGTSPGAAATGTKSITL